MVMVLSEERVEARVRAVFRQGNIYSEVNQHFSSGNPKFVARQYLKVIVGLLTEYRSL